MARPTLVLQGRRLYKLTKLYTLKNSHQLATLIKSNKYELRLLRDREK